MSQPRFYPQYTLVAANTSTDTTIKSAGGGVLGKVIVLVLGTAALDFQDVANGHAGSIIFTIPASAAVGTIYNLDIPVTLGITIHGVANSPGINVLWS